MIRGSLQPAIETRLDEPVGCVPVAAVREAIRLLTDGDTLSISQ
jgi:hypothetical protein